MAYHITGFVSATIFLLTLAGLWSQLELVWRRKRWQAEGYADTSRPTAILSLNQFASSFFAFFAFFLYGSCLQRFNHYLVWPRLAATLLVLVILYEIMADRKDALSTLAFYGCLALIATAPFFLLWSPQLADWGRIFSQGLVMGVTIILAQGYTHQIILIRQCGRTGAVSLRMHQFFFLKDLSTIAFAFAMGLASGWPLLLLSSVSALTKAATLWHFRWARLSPQAQRQRAAAQTSPNGLGNAADAWLV